MKYKVGEKVVMKIISADQDEIKTYSVSGVNDDWRWCLPQNLLERYTEPLSTYTEPLEAKIRRQASEITRLLAENKRLWATNKHMESESMRVIVENNELRKEMEQAEVEGAEAAWELARKIVRQPINGGYKQSEFEEIFGCGYISDIFEKYTYPEAAAKVEAWEKAKEEIKVGDVLHYKYDKEKCICITTVESNNNFSGVDKYGKTFSNRCDDVWKKTGRHIDVDSFLKQIGGAE